MCAIWKIALKMGRQVLERYWNDRKSHLRSRMGGIKEINQIREERKSSWVFYYRLENLYAWSYLIPPAILWDRYWYLHFTQDRRIYFWSHVFCLFFFQITQINNRYILTVKCLTSIEQIKRVSPHPQTNTTPSNNPPKFQTIFYSLRYICVHSIFHLCVYVNGSIHLFLWPFLFT